MVLVVDGRAVACTGGEQIELTARTLAVAEEAASVVGASVAGVELALTKEGIVVWDIQPVPAYRDARPITALAPAAAIAAAALTRLGVDTLVARDWERTVRLGNHHRHRDRAAGREEVTDGIVLSA